MGPVAIMCPRTSLVGDFDLRVAGPDGTRCRLEIYTEGDGAQFPKIFAASEEEVVAEGLPCVLLGKCMGVIQASSNGARQLLLLTKDDQGLDNPAVPLGASIRESADKLVPEIVETIRDAIEQRLASDFASEDKRAELSKKVVAEVETIKEELDGDVTNRTNRVPHGR